MRNRRAIAIAVSALLISGFTGSVARAVDPSPTASPTRVEQAALLKAKWMPQFEEQHKTLLALQKTLSVDPTAKKTVKSILTEYDSNIGAFAKGLDNPNQAIQPLVDLAEEEIEEFANYIFQLQQMVKQLKTITCVKGKVIKKVTAIKPACPAGYRKK